MQAFKTNGLEHSPLRLPSPLKSRGYHSARYSAFLRPLCKYFSLTVDCNNMVRTAIAILLRGGCPSAILWLIVPVFIRKAINRMLQRWALSHVSQELDVVLPLVANFDSPSAVVGKARVIWVSAAVPHSRPNHKCQRIGTAMLEIFTSGALATKASARSRLDGFKKSCSHLNLFAAVANTVPNCLAAFREHEKSCERYNFKSPELVSGEVIKSRAALDAWHNLLEKGRSFIHTVVMDLVSEPLLQRAVFAFPECMNPPTLSTI
jgi:hypothetical protein